MEPVGFGLPVEERAVYTNLQGLEAGSSIASVPETSGNQFFGFTNRDLAGSVFAPQHVQLL
jgi:hypothetical protein